VDVDPQLVRACQRGQPGAMDALIRGTYGDVYALCRRLLGDPSDAADATQEVYLRVVRSVLAFRGESAFGTWLHRVTVNVCLTALTRRGDVRGRGQSAGYAPFGLPDGIGEPTADEPGPEDRAERADPAARTARALAGLSVDAQEVVVLRDVQGLSTRETAELLGITEGAVKVRLHRAHARLRELVEAT
jgi:RNA polymerase sigma-70 factor, ECF subfamily